MDIRRRKILKAALGAAAAASVNGWRGMAPAAAQTGGSVTATSLREGISLIRGAGGNVVLLQDGGTAAMVDSGAPENMRMLAALIDERTGDATVDVLFNTHWHLSHTGGNEHYSEAGATIVAHENTRLWMSTEHYVEWEDRTYPPRSAAALPTDTFYSSDPQPIELRLGDEQIDYGYLREAHTDGDIYVLFRRRNVLVAGGAVTTGAYPVLDFATGGWVGGLVKATERLLDLADDETLIVPAVGPACARSHLVAQHDMLTTVRGRVEDLMRRGRSAEEMLAAGVTDEFDGAWGNNRERFISNMYDGLWWQGRLDGSL
jgi:glyoxylase-like metal-dependent hydrolase (beta-lactamase superfamily II)